MVKMGAGPSTFLTVKGKLKFIRPDGVTNNNALRKTCPMTCFFPSYFKQAVTHKKTGASENDLCRYGS